jgi:hypothetical protein
MEDGGGRFLPDPSRHETLRSLLLEIRSRLSKLRGSQTLQAFRTFFVFSADLIDARINRLLRITVSLRRLLLQCLHLCVGLGFDLLRPLFRLVEFFLQLGVEGVNLGL